MITISHKMCLIWQISAVIALIIPGLKCDILTLSKNNKVTCVLTGNSSYSATYIHPFNTASKCLISYYIAFNK